METLSQVAAKLRKMEYKSTQIKLSRHKIELKVAEKRMLEEFKESDFNYLLTNKRTAQPIASTKAAPIELGTLQSKKSDFSDLI